MLNALQLAGFKSFADRTHFAFPDGITVIVGPNGSGKSNVVDAIKWVMGEQSARSLRGGEMADVIFKGSTASGRKPSNTAEATLIFDNRERRLDVDADEVHVSRRVYRSGEGEYLINKRPCRLRDVKDMFRGTGMGADAYSLIEQGKVDTLLQATPRDRRAIFEEAAGISRFKAKKVEAQRRLERVEQNLLRLSDIVEELESRLRSLRSQAGKARRYQQYTERLQQLRTQVGLADYRRIQGQLSQALDADRNWTTQLDSVSAETESLEARRLEMDTELEMLEQRVRSAESRVASQRQKYAAARATIESQHRRLDELSEEQIRLGKSLVHLRQNTGDVGQNLNAGRAQLERAQTERDQLEVEVQAEHSSLDAISQQLVEMQMQMETVRDEHLKSIRQSTDLESQIKHWAMRQEEQVQASKTAADRVDAAAETVTALQVRQQSQHATLEKLDCDDVEARQKYAQVRNDLEQTRSAIELLQDQMARRRAAFEGLRERASVLEELESRQEGLNEGTKAMLHRAGDTKGIYGDVCGIVADLIRVDVEVAQLVDVALGERSQYVVLRGTRLLQAIASGQVNIPGRAGIISLQNVVAREPDAEVTCDWETVEGVLGRADHFVETQPEYADLIDRLLRDTWFAKRLSDVAQLRKHAPHVRWITGTGDIWEPDGTIVLGGFRNRHRIVSRRSELRTHHEEMQVLQHQIQSDELELREARDRLLALQQDLELRQQHTDQLRDDLQVARMQSQQLEQQCQAAREAVARARQEQQTADTGAQTACQEQSRAQARLDALRASFATREQQLNELTDRLRQASAKRDGDMNRLARQNAELARRQQHVTHCAEQVQRLERERAERERAEADLQQEHRRCWQTHAQIEQSLLAASAELAELALSIDAQEDASRQAYRQQQSIGNARRLLLEQWNALRAEHRRVDDGRQANQLQLERLRNQLESLLARYREEYELDLVAWADQSEAQEAAERESIDEEIAELRRKISNIGAVNMEALRDLQALEARYQDLAGQHQDLASAKESLGRIIAKINADSRRLFADTLQHIRGNFRTMFRKVFGGGEADIVFEDEGDILESGIDIVATPPGKQSLRLSLLSGGERALTAVTLLLAIFQYRPSPFCVLDEVDGPLDEANIGRFIQVLNEFLGPTKFVIVTHSKVTMTAATTLYGITMEESGISKQVSVRFEDVSEDGQITSVEDDERAA